MSNTKHTPGEWLCSANGIIYSEPVGTVIAEVFMPQTDNNNVYPETEEETTANRALLRTAPELLAACKAMAAIYVDDGRSGLKELADALAAIAKAEGK